MNRHKLLLFSLFVGTSLQAKVSLPAFFTDHMVVQQNSLLILPGTANAGSQVTVEVGWDTRKYSCQAAADGSFRIEIPTPKAGGPYTITLSDGEKLVLNQVLSGEIWFCSGQSNMEMPVGGWGNVLNHEEEISAANHPSIRLLQVKKAASLTPASEVEVNGGGWKVCAPTTVPEFSAIAYFYARELSKKLKVPIGVIDCTWGGTPAEAWTSTATLEHVLGFGKELKKAEVATPPVNSAHPGALYNAMVHPFTLFPVRGVIWYQGESNVGRDQQYTPLFQSLIADWRKQWKRELPFYFVQLANYLKREELQPHSPWAALREAQAQALHLDNTGMVVALDLGEAHDIHPKNKQEVARRLAVLALADTYRKGRYEVPLFQGYRISGQTLILRFDREVVNKASASQSFILSGPDYVFHSATAVIRGNEVLLTSPEVEIPIAARYGWADNPECSLYGTTGLPVAPFRTDPFTKTNNQ